jgi:hypothetical protein
MAYENDSDPQIVTIRPLNKGMRRNVPSQLVPQGGLITGKNVRITSQGWKRRAGFSLQGLGEVYAENAQTKYKHIDMAGIWTPLDPDQEQERILFTDGVVYRLGLSSVEEIDWYYDGGTISVSGFDVTGVGTLFITNGIYPGDIVRIGAYEARIESVVSETVLELEDSSLIPSGSGLSYSIHKAINNDPMHLVDWVVADGELIFTDCKRPLQVYKYGEPANSQIVDFIDEDAYKIDVGSGPEDFVCGCLAVFEDRLVVGYTIEATDGVQRTRLRWSTATNKRDFSVSTAFTDDLSAFGVRGALRRLVPLKNCLIAYCDDGIFLGTSTANADLPFVFERIETGNIGIVGMKAICSFFGGHFLIGQNDMYMLTLEDGIQKIGMPVVDQTIKISRFLERCYVAPDPQNDQVVFGFTESSDKMEKLWLYNYVTKEWSYADVSTYMIANVVNNYNIVWNEMTGFSWDTIEGIFPTWDSTLAKYGAVSFFTEFNYYLRVWSPAGVDDIIHNEDWQLEHVVINMELETPDFDFDTPELMKTFLRLNMKIFTQDVLATALPFGIQASWNRGRSWESVGTLTIEANGDEGYVSLLMTSSHVRFKITNASAVAPFVVEEISIKVKARGEELHTGYQS